VKYSVLPDFGHRGAKNKVMLIKILRTPQDSRECLRHAKEEYDMIYGSAESGPVSHMTDVSEKQKIWMGLSQASGLTACVISDQPVGVSVKRMIQRDFFVLSSRFFAHREATRKRYLFYKLWTAKAAQSAMIGEGLPDALRRSDYRAVSHFEFLYGYALSVAGEGRLFVVLFWEKVAK